MRSIFFSTTRYFGSGRRAAFAVLLLTAGCALLSGCSAISRRKIVPDSIAQCRELAQQGASAMEMGDSTEAERLLMDAVKKEPTDAEARRQLAEALWKNDNRPQAVLHMETARRLDEEHAPTVIRCGEMLLAMGDTERAKQRAEAALTLAPHVAEAWALRGRVLREMGEPKRALADLQQALRYAPHDVAILDDVARLQFDLGRPHQCLATVQCLLDVYPKGEEPRDALWLEGLAYGALDRNADAADSLAEATRRGEPPAELLYQLALASNRAGRPADAASAAERALAADAAHGPSRALLASLKGQGLPSPRGTILR